MRPTPRGVEKEKPLCLDGSQMLHQKRKLLSQVQKLKTQQWRVNNMWQVLGARQGAAVLQNASQDARQSCWRGRSGWGPWSSPEGPQAASVRIPTGPCRPSGDTEWFGTQQWFNQLCLRHPALATVERRGYRQEKLKDRRFSGLFQVCEDLN